MARLSYLFKVMNGLLTNPDRNCPHCGSSRTKLTGRKFGLLQLRMCEECLLHFRYPKDNISSNKEFYSGHYKETGGITTSMPSEVDLAEMLKTSFAGTGKDFSERISLMKTYVSSGRLLTTAHHGDTVLGNYLNRVLRQLDLKLTR